MTDERRAFVISELTKRVKQAEADLKTAKDKEERAELKGYLYGMMRVIEAVWQGRIDPDDHYIAF